MYQHGELLELRAKEYQILTLFMKYPGRVYTKKEIYEYLWDEPYYNDDNTIMVHISNLRDKVEENPKQPQKIITIRGLGYMLKKEKDITAKTNEVNQWLELHAEKEKSKT